MIILAQAPPQLATGAYSLETVFANVTRVAVPFGGIAMFVMLTIGGFKYMSAGDDPQKAQAAKKTLTFAVGGMTLMALSFLILLAISAFTGNTDILNFRIFFP